ncbi:glycosyltransferase involved in cell wall biosynthesis [Lewinella marina]|uniref:Glycosyl transferase n=1 Tax=Neolewinella marina TaxID=438751 RepID=A0A2G0CH85_9BACT|nr:glycosyltransferase [Neolewinella marina]NJB86188.1 glycosyltransferase involved in cell wall biosynthesis [Neolewinella marina]PHK99336.1 glycosyl transferase [Neolewinella marina]
MRLHLIIPVVNERDNLNTLLPFLSAELAGRGTITVADGGSTDGTREACNGYAGVRHLACTYRGRARQMNEAAALDPDRYDVLYFLHADARPPRGFYDDIRRSVAFGHPVGCYRFRFDSAHPLLAINAFCTRFSGLACRGGDQSLYLTRAAWNELGGFDANMTIMEDYDIIQRAWDRFPFRVIPRAVTVSARKYRANGWLRVQLANLTVFRMYKKGAPQGAMVERYRQMLKPW